MEEKKAILSATEIRKTFSHPAPNEILKGVSLTLFPGESIAIMGTSGEGKTTLLHILGTLEEATSGELVIAGKSVAHHPSSTLRNQHIGFIFQSFNLLEDYSSLQNVLMPALIAGKSIHKGSPAYEHGLSLLDQVGLSHRAHFTTKLLSGGEKQRVAIARALCNDPEMIFADEPSGNLDHANSERIHELLLHCVKELNKTLIVVTHDGELASLCNRKLTLCDGRLN